MRAMVLAAGLGTRLRPLTESRPKALIEVSGRTLLSLVLERLRGAGVREVIVNVHHFADVIQEYLEANDRFGMRIEISREETLLDTGGGLKQASWFFLEDPARLDEGFVLHNVDILSTIDLKRMTAFHRDTGSLATLAVRNRATERGLLFDEDGILCGHRTGDATNQVRPSPRPRLLDFSGVHVVSPRLLSMMTEDGAFSIITTYLRLAAEGRKILAFHADEYSWEDVGSLESLRRTEANN